MPGPPGALQPPRRRGSFGGSAKILPPTRQPGLISCRRASVWWLAPNILLYTTCRALLVAVLPNIKTAFFEGPGCAQHCASRDAAAIGGYFDSSAAAASFFLSAIIGACSDALGRKPFLLLTAVAAAAPLGALWLWPRNLWPFYALDCLSKALGGMSSGSVLASAYLADCYPVDQRTVVFGLLRAIGASASIASPLLGAYWHPVSSRHSDDGSSDGSDSSSGSGTQQQLDSPPDTPLFLLAFVVALVNVAYTLLLLPESLPSGRDRAASSGLQQGLLAFEVQQPPPSGRPPWSWRRINPFLPLKHLRTSSLMGWLAIVVFFSSLPESGILEASLYYLQTKLGYTVVNNAWLFAWYGICAVITQTLILRLLLQQWQLSELSILRFALCCNCVHLLLYAVAWPGEKWVPFIAIGVAALNFLGSTAITSLVSRHGDEQEQGLALGAIYSVTSLCSIFGPIMFGDLYKYAGQPPLNFPEAPFIVGAMLVLVAIVVSILPSALPGAVQAANERERHRIKTMK